MQPIPTPAGLPLADYGGAQDVQVGIRPGDDQSGQAVLREAGLVGRDCAPRERRRNPHVVDIAEVAARSAGYEQVGGLLCAVIAAGSSLR